MSIMSAIYRKLGLTFEPALDPSPAPPVLTAQDVMRAAADLNNNAMSAAHPTSNFRGFIGAEYAASQLRQLEEMRAQEAKRVESEVASTPVGLKFGNLTQIGSTYYNMDEIACVVMRPQDGCGIEITSRSGRTIHLGRLDQALWAKYFDQEQAKLTKTADEVKELEQLADR